MTLREYGFDLSSSSPRFLSIFDLEEDDDSDEISFKFEIEIYHSFDAWRFFSQKMERWWKVEKKAGIVRRAIIFRVGCYEADWQWFHQRAPAYRASFHMKEVLS